jgi:Lipocalin-like domain
MAKKIIGLLLVVGALSITLLGQNDQDKAEVRRKIVGTWKLVLEENTLKDGSKTHDFGLNGKGFLMYSADGHMCAVEMNPDRPKWRNPEEPTLAEKASAFDGSYGYCGPYEIDTKHSQLIHLPEVSTGPGYVGTRQLRPYQFEGNRLILTGGTVEDEPEVASWKVVWEKVR